MRDGQNTKPERERASVGGGLAPEVPRDAISLATELWPMQRWSKRAPARLSPTLAGSNFSWATSALLWRRVRKRRKRRKSTAAFMLVTSEREKRVMSG